MSSFRKELVIVISGLSGGSVGWSYWFMAEEGGVGVETSRELKSRKYDGRGRVKARAQAGRDLYVCRLYAPVPVRRARKDDEEEAAATERCSVGSGNRHGG